MPVVADQNTISFLSEKYVFAKCLVSRKKMKKTENFLSEYWCCVSLIAKLVMANRLHLEEQFGWEQCGRQAGSVLQIVQSYEQSCQGAPH